MTDVSRDPSTISGNKGNATVVQVESKLGAFALSLAALALGLSIAVFYVQATSYRELEREVRLQQLKLDEYRVALMNAHIEPNPHVEGEMK